MESTIHKITLTFFAFDLRLNCPIQEGTVFVCHCYKTTGCRQKSCKQWPTKQLALISKQCDAKFWFDISFVGGIKNGTKRGHCWKLNYILAKGIFFILRHYNLYLLYINLKWCFAIVSWNFPKKEREFVEK